ncbi:esterase/lipase/thioesterase [Cutibacterium acnes JCM 18916]|nr:esterase/lipase/thioesterase [Cutibacterium acnes JCM 18916]GAE74411.1 esterase/lipase/thioesterase [Cutibacterium acnes JCM 18918]
MADTKTSRHSWLRITSGLVGLILTLPVLAWSVAAILPSHNALTFISSVLVGSLAVPALVIAVIAFVLALLGRGGLRVVAVVFSVMASSCQWRQRRRRRGSRTAPVDVSTSSRQLRCRRCPTTLTKRSGMDPALTRRPRSTVPITTMPRYLSTFMVEDGAPTPPCPPR